jgi:hypothetical protein
MDIKIKTTFKGPTDFKGARIFAKCNGRQASIHFPYELSGSNTHEKAARTWIEKHMSRNGWDDTSRFKLRPLNTLENGYLWEVYK